MVDTYAMHQNSVKYVKKHYGDMPNKRFHEKSGFCSVYAHACGYMDTYRCNDYKLTLELDCHWIVRVHHAAGTQVFWETLTSRPEAKRLFLHLRRMIKNGATEQQIANAYI